jgi:hypothetical protein
MRGSEQEKHEEGKQNEKKPTTKKKRIVGRLSHKKKKNLTYTHRYSFIRGYWATGIRTWIVAY